MTHPYYVLGIFFIVYVFNFIDRQSLAILLEAIKKDLGASDTAMRFLSGFALAIFYTFWGILIARWADLGVEAICYSLTLVAPMGLLACLCFLQASRTLRQELVARDI